MVNTPVVHIKALESAGYPLVIEETLEQIGFFRDVPPGGLHGGDIGEIFAALLINQLRCG